MRSAQRIATVTLTLTALVATATPATAATNGPIDTSNRQAVVNAYRTWLAPTQKVAPGWTGNISKCRAGDNSAKDKNATLSAVNYVRAMAQLPPVTLNEEWSRKSLAAALIMDANRWLDHTPPKSAKCWTPAGYDGASHGNLFLGYGYGKLSPATGPRAVVGYMDDDGSHNKDVGHRRWLTYQSLTQIGTGDTNNANSIYVVDDSQYDNWNPDNPPIGPAPQWVSWPTTGYFPREIEPHGRWSLSYPDADFHNATVKVSGPGGTIKAKRLPVHDGYGDNTLSWDVALPSTARTGKPYPVTVTVTGIGMPDGTTTSRQWTTTLIKAS